MQIDLMVNSFAADFARVATLQYTNSVGRRGCAGSASTRGTTSCRTSPTANDKAAGEADEDQQAGSASSWPIWPSGWPRRPSRAAAGSLLDNTLIVWTNELGKGNSHTLDNIPFVLVGNGLDFKHGPLAQVRQACRTTACCCRWPTASATGSTTFGNPDFCGDGPLHLS